MFQLQMIHQTAIQNFNPQINTTDLPADLVWETCRRKIYFYDTENNNDALKKQAGWLQGLDAEAFMIQVLCGLESPLIGETEVLGQFKKLIEDHASNPWVEKLKKYRLQQWLTIIKDIREKYLCHLGSQSYGSYLRRNIHAKQKVAVIGSGQLTQEILPWLDPKSGFNPPVVYARDIQKASLSLQKVKTPFEIKSLHEFDTMITENQTLIIAAPLSHSEVKNLLNDGHGVNQVFDLRRDSSEFSDRSKCSLLWVDLDAVMASFSLQKERLGQRSQAALEAIEQWKQRESNRATIRPFGWEDLCI